MGAVFRFLLFWISALPSVEAFLAPPRPVGFQRAAFGCSPTLLRAVQEQPADTSTESTKEEDLSDVDARVLKSLLQDSKLDLETEDDVRKLLERGTVKSVPKQPEPEPESESDFSSQALKTLTDTVLWKKVSAQASDIFESVGIWVSNKVEQDVKTLAALGIFAWDRAVRDVARALPEAGTFEKQAKKTIFLLTNSSAYVEPPPAQEEQEIAKSAEEELRRSSDEIKTVSREILGILSGKQRSSSGRGLRTAAPAGFTNSAERQRRAYQQSRRIDRQEKDVRRMAGSVVDSAWELKRELTAETSKPGYKTKPIRNAIEAGVIGTGNALNAVKEQAKLAAARRKQEKQLKAAGLGETTQQREQVNAPFFVDDTSPVSFATVSELEAAIEEERQRINEQLRKCIEEPGDNWLKLVSGDVSDESLRNVVTMMVLLRNDIIEQNLDENAPTEARFGFLLDVRDKLQDLLIQADNTLPLDVSKEMSQEFLGDSSDGRESYLIAMIGDVLDYLQLVTTPDTVNEEPVDSANGFAWWEDALASEATAAGSSSSSIDESSQDADVDATPRQLDILDVDVGTVIATPTNGYDTDPAAEVVDDIGSSQSYRGVVAEVVSDDDFDGAVGTTAAAQPISEEMEEEEPNFAIQIALRSLDVVFFVLEKVVIAGIPQAFTVSVTATQRLADVNSKGLGKNGWVQFQRLSNTKGRY